jgi:hypothetical protein
MESLKFRLKNFKLFKKFFNGLDDKKKSVCIKENKVSDKLVIDSSVTKKSQYADILLGKTSNKNTIGIALKKIPLSFYDITVIRNINNLSDITPRHIYYGDSDPLTELFFLNITTKLLEKKITFNLPFVYDYFLCDECVFNNPKVIKRIGKAKSTCLYLVTEKANGDLEAFVSLPDTTEKDIYNAYLQIYIGIYALKKYYNIYHQDLHRSNVLYFKTKPGGYWKYIIKNKDIYIPNYGTVFILWDFSYAVIPEKVYSPINNRIYNNSETDPFFEDNLRILGIDPFFKKPVKNIQKLLENSDTHSQVIFKLYDVYKKLYPFEDPDTKDVIETYNTGKAI